MSPTDVNPTELDELRNASLTQLSRRDERLTLDTFNTAEPLCGGPAPHLVTSV